jgi:hypothetical protein
VHVAGQLGSRFAHTNSWHVPLTQAAVHSQSPSEAQGTLPHWFVQGVKGTHWPPALTSMPNEPGHGTTLMAHA